MDNTEIALSAIIRSMKIIAEDIVKKSKKDVTYDGLIKTINSDGTYIVFVNGRNYTLPLYINRTLVVNQSVKVMFPQNNASNAFII